MNFLIYLKIILFHNRFILKTDQNTFRKGYVYTINNVRQINYIFLQNGKIKDAECIISENTAHPTENDVNKFFILYDWSLYSLIDGLSNFNNHNVLLINDILLKDRYKDIEIILPRISSLLGSLIFYSVILAIAGVLFHKSLLYMRIKTKQNQIILIGEHNKKIYKSELACPICYVTLNNEEYYELKCNHVFHCTCLSPWLMKHSMYCPLCPKKYILLDKQYNFNK